MRVVDLFVNLMKIRAVLALVVSTVMLLFVLTLGIPERRSRGDLHCSEGGNSSRVTGDGYAARQNGTNTTVRGFPTLRKTLTKKPGSDGYPLIKLKVFVVFFYIAMLGSVAAIFFIVNQDTSELDLGAAVKECETMIVEQQDVEKKRRKIEMAS